jgi:hypothetical protein
MCRKRKSGRRRRKDFNTRVVVQALLEKFFTLRGKIRDICLQKKNETRYFSWTIYMSVKAIGPHLPDISTTRYNIARLHHFQKALKSFTLHDVWMLTITNDKLGNSFGDSFCRRCIELPLSNRLTITTWTS